MPLLICRTCPRYDSDSGAFGVELDRALAAEPGSSDVRRRHVFCVGGCPEPGSVALDSLGKARVRFSGVGPADAAALLQASAAYEASDSGEPGEWTVPGSLRVTGVTRKQLPTVGRWGAT